MHHLAKPTFIERATFVKMGSKRSVDLTDQAVASGSKADINVWLSVKESTG